MRLSMARSYGTSPARVERWALNFLNMVALMVTLLAGVPAWAQSASSVENAPARPLKLVVLGDSLSAGLGLPGQAAFPARLQKALNDSGANVEISNAGVSGDTASGGRDRLDWSVPEGTRGVIVELGANDALRGIDPKITRDALADIVARLKSRGIAVMLCGMLAPPNYGADYASQFNAIYPELAKSFDVALYRFFLDGVAANPTLNQADGIHPTAQGVDIIVSRILPAVEAFVGSIQRQPS